jgi:hypothetical protein
MPTPEHVSFSPESPEGRIQAAISNAFTARSADLGDLRDAVCQYLVALKARGVGAEDAASSVRDVISRTPPRGVPALADVRPAQRAAESLTAQIIHWCVEQVYGTPLRP